MRLFLVGLKIGISKSRETGRDERTSQRDKTFIIHVGDNYPVISSNKYFLNAYLPSSVLSSLKTKIPLLSQIQYNARVAGVTVCVEVRRSMGQ